MKVFKTNNKVDTLTDTVKDLYHVTKKKSSTYSKLPNCFFDEKNDKKLTLQAYGADDENYDQCLVEMNAPKGVFFNCFLYKGYLPDKSKYPRGTEDMGDSFIRIIIPIKDFAFERDVIKFFFVGSVKGDSKITQSHMVIIDSKKYEKNYEWCRKKLTEIKKDENLLFWCLEGEWKTPNYKEMKEIVNIFIVGDVETENYDTDEVKKM